MLDSTDNQAMTVQRSITEKSALTQDGNLVGNPSQRTLNENGSIDDEVSQIGKKKRPTPNDSSHLNLEDFDRKSTHPPSRIKSQAEKIQDYVEEIEKHKRTIGDLTEKLASCLVTVNQNQQTNDKKFAALEAMFRKQSKKSAGEVISAFNTGRSFASKHSSNK